MNSSKNKDSQPWEILIYCNENKKPKPAVSEQRVSEV